MPALTRAKPVSLNMSMGGLTESCPAFLQSKVNAAVAAGFTIVAAAGNNTLDVSGFAPANCDNVITVVVVDKYADLIGFSNFGAGIEVVAQGEDIISVCYENTSTACYWDGTSFAASLVTGIAAIVKQKTGLSYEQLKQGIQMTSSSKRIGAHCTQGMCGAGVVNAKGLMEFGIKYANGELNTIAFALGENSPCDQTWFVDNFGDSARLCELYKVTFMGGK